MENRGSFEDWLRAGAPDPAGDIDTVQAVENAINSVSELSRIFHKLASAQISGLRDVLGDDPCDEAQKWFDLGLTDMVSDSIGTLVKATEEAAPSRELPVIKTPDFAALTATANCVPTPESKTDFASASVVNAGDA